MKPFRKTLTSVFAPGLALATLVPIASAEGFPSKPFEMIIDFKPGGLSDAMAWLETSFVSLADQLWTDPPSMHLSILVVVRIAWAENKRRSSPDYPTPDASAPDACADVKQHWRRA